MPPANSSNLIYHSTPQPHSSRKLFCSAFLLGTHWADFHSPGSLHRLCPLPGSFSPFSINSNVTSLERSSEPPPSKSREDSPVLCIPLSLYSFFFITPFTIYDYLCLFIGLQCFPLPVLKMGTSWGQGHSLCHSQPYLQCFAQCLARSRCSTIVLWNNWRIKHSWAFKGTANRVNYIWAWGGGWQEDLGGPDPHCLY